MKITFDIGWWLDVDRKEDNIILSTSDDNGNDLEIIIKDGWLNKRRIKQFIKDLEEQSSGEKK